jgi:YrbI family 3-deoxy-D-manno-octulosonate 8-phosphate phosphatase
MISLIVYDFDGVMTDNTVMVNFMDWYDNHTTYHSRKWEAVRCHRDDGYGVQLFKKKGVQQLILSSESNPVVSIRAKKLGIECHQNVIDKWGELNSRTLTENIIWSETVYLGNGLNDIEVMKAVGYPVAVADAHPEVLKVARMILRKKGGEGAVLNLYEMLLTTGEF